MSKLTLQLSPEMDDVLDELSEARGLPKAQVVRQAMLIMKYLDEQMAEGKDVILRDKETAVDSQLVFESRLGNTATKSRAKD